MSATPSTSPVDVLEALLFASDVPLEADRIREVMGLADAAEARALVEELRARVDTAGRALQITEVAGGYRMVTRPEVAPWLVRLARSRTRARLSRPALETLAIVGYRQPVSRPEIDAIRGVNSEGVLDSLLERRLVRIAGRKEAPGRPFLYETTREFLVAFGLRDIAELPKVDGELIVPDLGADGATTAQGDGAPGGEGGAALTERASDGPDSAAGEGDVDVAITADSTPSLEPEDAQDGALVVDVTPAGMLATSEEAGVTADDAVVASTDVGAAAASEGEHAEGQAQQAPGASGTDVETGR